MSRALPSREARTGSIAGAAGDAGVEYRRAVAAYAAAHGLAGMPLLGFGVPSAHAQVTLVALETDDPVDDIRIEFASGCICMVQAKRTLGKGKSFDKAVEQWVAAARRGLDPARDHLTIVSSSLSQTMRTLSRVLDRFNTDAPGALTNAEDAVLAHLHERLAVLTDDQRDLVLRCGSIRELGVEEEHFTEAREGALLLTQIVRSDSAARAWSVLVALAGLTARRRGGLAMDGWMAGLLGAGVEIDTNTQSLAAELARRHAAVERYLSMLRRRARVLDLRGIGASLPALPLADVDAKVRVLTDASDERSESDLLWAAFRRGRTVLTGLPGGGKSTAVAVLAADLTAYADTSLPLLASLREVDSLDRSLGFRERLLVVALRDLDPADRDLVREEMEVRLRRGGLMLLLDSLDETYRRRGAVVSQIETFLGDCSPDVDVLLATRDVAYGQAATLGWADLRLAAPKDVERTIVAILQAAAVQRKCANPSDWIRPKQSWVLEALRSAPALRETPLLPVLLTLLSIEREDGTLPRERARILADVVQDVIARREANRRDPFVLGELHDSAATSVALQVFALEASGIMASGGQCEMRAVIAPIAEALVQQWALGPGPAQVAAEAAIRFWDETGIFVMSGATETIAPRVALFAEIGDAIAVSNGRPEGTPRWVADSVQRGSVEALVLAAGLSKVVACEFASTAVKSRDHELLLAAARALREGAQLDAASHAALMKAILADAAVADAEGWDSWLMLARLPTVQQPDHLVEALANFPPEYWTVGQALVDLRWRSRAQLESNPETLMEVLRLDRLPRLGKRSPVPQDDLRVRVADNGFVEAVGAAAEIVVGVVDDAADVVISRLRSSPLGLQERLEGLLQSRGYGPQASQALAEQRAKFARAVSQMVDFDRDAPEKLLERLASRTHSPLDHRQRVRLDELADFVETLNLDEMSSWVGGEREERLPDVIELIAVLGGFDLGVIAAEAAIVLERMHASRERAPFYALFDCASARELDRWHDVASPALALDLLVGMLYWGRGNARVASSALWCTPVAHLAAPLLRDALPELEASTEHQRIAALTLASLSSVIDTPEPGVWAEDPNPVLRIVAANWCVETVDGRVNPDLRRFLEDPDGNVREAALRSVFKSGGHDKQEVLSSVAASADPGWMCLSCRAGNRPGKRSCANDNCHRAPPKPAQDARRMLDGTYKSYH